VEHGEKFETHPEAGVYELCARLDRLAACPGFIGSHGGVMRGRPYPPATLLRSFASNRVTSHTARSSLLCLCCLLLTFPGHAAAGAGNFQLTGIVQPADGERSLPRDTLVELRDDWGGIIRAYVSQGHFRFTNLQAKRYTLYVRAEGYETVRRSLDGRYSGTEAISLEVRLVRNQPAEELRDSHVVSLRTLLIPSNALKRYETGVEQLRKDRFRAALTSFNRAIKLHPEFAEAYAGKGAALMKLKDAEEAESALRKAVELDPELPAARKRLGYLLLVTERYAEAEEHLVKGVSPGSQDSHLWTYLGEVWYHLERFPEAYEALSRALELYPENYQASYRQGFVCLKLHRRAEAIASFEDFLSNNRGWDDSDIKSLVSELSRLESFAGRAGLSRSPGEDVRQ
jgi:tetratricopeptide (TPR) repeat protein